MNPKLGIHLNLELGNKMTLELRNHLNFFTFYLGNNLVADIAFWKKQRMSYL